MLEFMNNHSLWLVLIACVLCSLAVFLPLYIRMRKMQRVLRGRMAESEKRMQAQQSQLIESIS